MPKTPDESVDPTGPGLPAHDPPPRDLPGDGGRLPPGFGAGRRGGGDDADDGGDGPPPVEISAQATVTPGPDTVSRADQAASAPDEVSRAEQAAMGGEDDGGDPGSGDGDTGADPTAFGRGVDFDVDPLAADPMLEEPAFDVAEPTVFEDTEPPMEDAFDV